MQPPLLRHVLDNPLPPLECDVIYGWSQMYLMCHSVSHVPKCTPCAHTPAEKKVSLNSYSLIRLDIEVDPENTPSF